MNPRRAGFTLIECAVTCAMAAVLAAIAIPSYQGRERRMARLDAVDAITRVQATQEQHRSAHGLYATELGALRVAPTSAQGRYALTLERTGAESFRAVARASGSQRRDHDCPELTLDVAQGFPTYGPKAACWNR